MTHLMETHKLPEVVDNGGLIARRIIALADKDEDMGAMLARALICRQQDVMGDGTATAAVLFQAIYDRGVQYLASGGNATRLRHHLDKALPTLLNALDDMTFPIAGKDNLTRLAETLCHDRVLAQMLGEIFDIIGEYGQLDIRKDQGRGLRREYVEGMYWNSGLFSRDRLGEPGVFQNEYENTAILLIDFRVDEPRDFMPLLEQAVANRVEALVIVAPDLSENAMAGLLLANQKLPNFQVMAVKTPGTNAEDRAAAIEDIAVLTGASPLLRAAGHTLQQAAYRDFGWARRVWANPRSFGLVGGKGDPRRLRQHLGSLQTRFARSNDPDERDRVQHRIGKLMGGSATLWIGGSTEPEIAYQKSLAERTARTIRAAVREGVVPGGGVALLACRAAMDGRHTDCTDPDERAAYRILHHALAEPARAIFANAGYDPGDMMAQISGADKGCGFDVRTGSVVDMQAAGIVDSTAVIKAALHNAVATAGLALSIDVLVHHRQPEIVTHPG